MIHFRSLLDGVASILWPNVCEMCGRTLVKGEKVLCLHCRSQLPVTDIHITGPNNTVEQRLTTIPPMKRVGAYCHYDRQSSFAKLIKHGKYHARPEILRTLGRWYAAELQQYGFFDGMDAIVPVPMHVWKRMRRGFNQSEWVARGVSDVTGLPVERLLTAQRGHDTQTRRSQTGRWQNACDIYKVRRGASTASRHLLLVDDVITSGATLTACAEALRQASMSVEISVLAIAAARMS